MELDVEYEPLMDADETAKFLGGLHPKTIMRMARRGELPAYRPRIASVSFGASGPASWISGCEYNRSTECVRFSHEREDPVRKTVSYQQGCLYREKRKAGPDVWVFRYRDDKVIVGTVDDFKTKTEAKKACESLRSTINRDADGNPTGRIVSCVSTCVRLLLVRESPNTSAVIPSGELWRRSYRATVRRSRQLRTCYVMPRAV
jgi:uncharacterized protein YegP (UPF0339 family)